jgi:hypothetical protein
LSQPAQPESKPQTNPNQKTSPKRRAPEEVVHSKQSTTTTKQKTKPTTTKMLQKGTERFQFAFPIGPRKNAPKKQTHSTNQHLNNPAGTAILKYVFSVG